MRTSNLFSGKASGFAILFARFALSVLQNITVDDAVLNGAVVPEYLPSDNNWAQGNECTGCVAKPDPSYAYNGTWHDTTFIPNSTIDQLIEFTFIGSGIYIFFILANNVSGATTTTNLNFILDGVQIGSFYHSPTASTDYDYNQTVYANSTITYGQHTMTIAPVNDSTTHILFLFDYLIYTAESSLSTTTTATNIVATSSQVVSTSTAARTASAGQNVGAIVGGTVGGVGALVMVIISLLFWKYKRNNVARYSPGEVNTVPFITFHQTPPISVGTSESTSLRAGSRPREAGPRRKTIASPVMVQPSGSVPTSTVPPSSDVSSSNNTELIQQVEMLRDEVARLRQIQDENRDAQSVPPPYS